MDELGHLRGELDAGRTPADDRETEQLPAERRRRGDRRGLERVDAALLEIDRVAEGLQGEAMGGGGGNPVEIRLGAERDEQDVIADLPRARFDDVVGQMDAFDLPETDVDPFAEGLPERLDDGRGAEASGRDLMEVGVNKK